MRAARVAFAVSLVPLACSLATSTDGLSDGLPSANDAGSVPLPNVPAEGGSVDAGPAEASPGDAGVDAPAASAYRAAVLSDGPFAYFPLDELAGTACRNQVADSAYSCAYSATGAALGAAGVAGSTGVGIGENGQVTIAATRIDLSQPYALEFWLEIDTPAPGDRLLVGIDPSPRNGILAFLFDGGEFRTEVWSGGGFVSYTMAASALAGKAWHHVVIGHEGARDFSYVDGVKSTGGDAQLPGGDPKNVTAPVVFGGFVGAVDEIAVYPAPLSAARVLAHYGLR